MTKLDSRVALVEGVAGYPEFPFEPEVSYPEFGQGAAPASGADVFGATREAFRLLGLDTANFGMPGWNPLAQFLKPGGTVLIKPNWVMHHNPRGDFESLVTHSALLRPLIEYAALGLRGKGRIFVSDAPLQSCDFRALMQRTRMPELIEEMRKHHPGVEFVIEDWRITVFRESALLTGTQSVQKAGREDYREVNLAEKSMLVDIEDFSEFFRVANYNPDLMLDHHRPGRHEYLVARRIFEADLIINVPKLKTHIKAGLTGALKNLVGINGHKEYLPHHIRGAYEDGGDNYMISNPWKCRAEELEDWYWRHVKTLPRWRREMTNFTRRGFRLLGMMWDSDKNFSGSWSGNETIARTTIDLNNILYFYDPARDVLSPTPMRTVLHVMDGITAGEGPGPLAPLPKKARLVLAGFNPAAVDEVQARLIGYNATRLPTLRLARYDVRSRFNREVTGEVQVLRSGQPSGNVEAIGVQELARMDFRLPDGWARCADGERLRQRIMRGRKAPL